MEDRWEEVFRSTKKSKEQAGAVDVPIVGDCLHDEPYCRNWMAKVAAPVRAACNFRSKSDRKCWVYLMSGIF